VSKTIFAILDILGRHREIIGSREISRQLKAHGIELTERTVRYHLRILDERGYTEVFGKEGRKITEKGREELKHALVPQKVGFVISKIESLAYQTTLDINTMKGDVILNVSSFSKGSIRGAVDALKPVFASPYAMSNRMIFKREGEEIGDVVIPEGMIGIGTVCSVTINGIFLKAGIPISSRFGGIVEVSHDKPLWFISIISYEGSSLDPLEIFIRSKMTNVSGALHKNSGKILASFREIPLICRDPAIQIANRMSEKGIQGILAIGEPNTPLLDIPVGIDKVGVVVVGGLNPIAAIEEQGIQTESMAMSTLYDYEKLANLHDALREIHEKDRGNYQTFQAG
jgi:HTH-type transcriptional regulator, global nitrogen regulator NrpRI